MTELFNNAITVWKINNIDINELSINQKYIFNSSSETNIGKTIYDICQFHMTSKNIVYNSDIHSIEAEIIKANNAFQIDYNRKLKNCPLFTILTFLSDDENLCITDIDLESYKYKEIKDENIFACFKASKNSQIVFDSSKYYGFYNSLGSKVLKINIWDNKIESNSNLQTIQESISQQYESPIIIQLKTPDIMESLIYKNIINTFLYEEIQSNIFINNILAKYEENSLIYIDNKSAKYIDIPYLQEKYGEVASDMYPFVNTNIDAIIDKETNRFYRNKIIQNILSKDVCYWIINEFEKLEWGVSKYQNYNTYINVEQNMAVLNFLLFISNFWLMELTKSYNCETIKLNITEMFVSKYTKEKIVEDKHVDGNFIIFNIYLNSNIDYKDGEILFENDERIAIQQGDLLLYNGKRMRTNGAVSDGVKYVLVLMVEIIP